MKKYRIPKIAAATPLLILALFFTVSVVGTVNAGKWRPIRPEKGGKRHVLIINDSEWAYWRLKPGESAVFPLKKPGPYKVITRADFGTKDVKEEVYTFRIGFGSEKTRLYSRASSPSATVALKGKKNRRIGESRTVNFTVDSNRRTMKIQLDRKAKYPVFFRVLRERDVYSGAAEFVAITPSSYRDAAGVMTNEEMSTYYLVDPEKKLTLEVNGPTTIKVLARLVMNNAMRGKIKFPLGVYEDGELKNTYSLQSSASTISQIINRKDVILSKGASLYIEVPAGRHRYNFNMQEDGREVLLRFFLPAADLGTEAQ